MIEREEIRFVADVDFTDDCRVAVELRKRRMTLTIGEAKALRSELDVAIAEASRGADELLRAHEPFGFDQESVCKWCGTAIRGMGLVWAHQHPSIIVGEHPAEPKDDAA